MQNIVMKNTIEEDYTFNIRRGTTIFAAFLIGSILFGGVLALLTHQS